MQTKEIVTRAMAYIGVVNGNDPLPASDLYAGMHELNFMMSTWPNEGLNMLPWSAYLDVYTPWVDLGPTDPFPLPDAFRGGTSALLAIELTAEYDEEITKSLLRKARRGWAQLVGEYHHIISSSKTESLIERQYGSTKGFMEG